MLRRNGCLAKGNYVLPGLERAKVSQRLCFFAMRTNAKHIVGPPDNEERLRLPEPPYLYRVSFIPYLQ